MADRRTNVGVFVFPGAEELDFAGPWEVLSYWAGTWPEDGASAFTVAREPGAVRCARGLRVLPDHAWADAPPIDVLVYPGGPGVRAHLGDGEVRAWLRRLAAGGAVLSSVCTGSLAFADAGLLDGRRATTHRLALAHLASLGRGVVVRAGERFVDEGAVVTAGGVAAGIDMALHLVGRLASPARAAEVARAIEYPDSLP